MDNLSPENKNTVANFTIDVKDGNRIGRRLRRGLTNLSGRRSGLNPEPFDPNAFDGDGDGLVQDGSQWERPAQVAGQVLPNVAPNTNTQIGTEQEPVTQRVQKETNRQVGLASLTSRGEKDEISPEVARVSKKRPDPNDPEWLRTATPREIAEVFIPGTLAENDALTEQLRIPRSHYETEEDYQKALANHRDVIKNIRELHGRKIQAMRKVYDAKYGAGEFDKNLSSEMSVYDYRIKELFGNQESFGTFVVPSNRDVWKLQIKWLTELSNSPNLPRDFKKLLDDTLDKAKNNRLAHGAFYRKGPNDLPLPLPVSPVEYIVASLVTGVIPIHSFEIIDDKALTESIKLISPDALKLVEKVMGSYFKFLENERLPGGGRMPTVLSPEQVKNRVDVVAEADSVFSLFGTLLPNRWQDNFFLRQYLQNQYPSEDPQDRDMLRGILLRALEQNPEFLAAVRKFGLPPVNVGHRVYSWADISSIWSQITPQGITEGPANLSEGAKKRRIRVGRALSAQLEKLLHKDSRRDQMADLTAAEASFGSAGHFDAYVALGGTYNSETGQIALTLPMLLTQILAPSMADDGIVPLSTMRQISEIVGESAVFIHEYGHYVDWTLRDNVLYLLWEKYKRMPFSNEQERIRQFRKELKTIDGFKDIKGGTIQHDPAKKIQSIQEIFAGTRQVPRLTPNVLPVGKKLFDEKTMSDEELNATIKELSAQLSEIHGSTELLEARRSRRSQDPNRQRMSAEEIGTQSITHPEPYVVTPYGNTVSHERFAELFASLVTRIGQEYPVLTNNAAVKLVSRILGINVEPQTVTRLARRKKQSNGTYSDQTEDISSRILSDIKLVAPEVERTSDGHRPGLGSSTSSRDLRFDPNERSRISSRSNLGLDTDERLYATTTPLLTTDYGSRARLYKIGDHHFYDRSIPYASFLNYRMRQSLGESAGRRFINRNNPHHGDMVRAISSTHFGLFVDDMPTYDTTLPSQIETLRGLVTGKITKLQPLQRFQIEEALKDATNIHSAIQAVEPTKRDLFRIIKVDRETFLEGLNVGDSIPMPITAFTSSVPSTNNPVIIRLVSGAKAIELDSSQFLTQGNFEITNIKDDGTSVIATLTHKEVFDPRHDAMRPVDRFSDVPGKMRKMGYALPRYTPNEQAKMEIDLAKRKDRADVLRARGFASSTSGSPRDVKNSDLTDEELTEFLVFEPKNRKDYLERIAPTFEKFKNLVKEHIDGTVRRRLAPAIKAIKAKYGTAQPWIDDVDAIRRWRTLDDETINQSTKTLKQQMLKRINAGQLFTFDGKQIKEPITARVFNESDRQDAEQAKIHRDFYRFFRRMAESEVLNLSATQIEHLLRTGELVYWDDDLPTPAVNQWYDNVREPTAPFIRIPELVNPTTKEFQDLRQVLETSLETLQAVQRAYLLDGSVGRQEQPNPNLPEVYNPTSLTGRIIVGDETIEVKPYGKGAYVALGAVGRYANSAMSFVMHATFTTDGRPHERNQYFKRDIFLDKDGNIKVRHESFFMRDKKSSGIGTVLQQHAALWWRQHDGTEVFLPNPAMDGIIVWPRLNYQFDINDPYADDPIGSFKEVRTQFVTSLRTILRDDAGLSEVETYGPGIKLADDIDYGLKGNPAFRKRLIGWLALARVQEQQGKVDPSLFTILANIIEPRELTKAQADNWKKLFAESDIASMGLTMKFDEELDSDWLPPFAIPDQQNDSLVPDNTTLRRAEIIKEITADKDAEFDLFIAGFDGDKQLTSEQAGRLQAIIEAGDGDSARLFRSAARARYARESAAFNSPVQLITELELKERIDAGVDVYFAVSDYSMGAVGTSIELRLTTEPFRLIDRLVDYGKPELDPAQNPNGVLAFVSPNAKIITIDKVEEIVKSLLPNDWTFETSDSDLMKGLIAKHGIEEEVQIAGRTVKIIRIPDGAITLNNSSESRQMALRLAKTIFDIENQLRMRGPDSKLEKLLTGLLEEVVHTGKVWSNNNIPMLLGFDAVKEGNNTLTILNNQVLQVFDEKVSLAQAARMINDPRFREIPKRLYGAPDRALEIIKEMMDNPSWFEDGDASRLLPDDNPIIMSRRGFNSSTYIRQVRQDFGVDLDSRLRRRGLSSSTAEKERQNQRRFTRIGFKTWIDDTDDSEFENRIAKTLQQFKDLQQELEDWDDADNAKGPDEPGDWAGREDIRRRMDEVADTFAFYINTSNNAVENALEQEGAIRALAKLIKEQEIHGDISPELVNRLRLLQTELRSEQNERPVQFDFARVRARHLVLKRALRDSDLLYEIQKYNDDLEPIELAELGSNSSDDIETKQRWFARSLFEALFGKKYQKQTFAYNAEQEMKKRLSELIDDVTDEQRNEWRTKLDERLDSEPDADFQEDLIDMYPESSTTRPRDVPENTWRKVRAAMSRARSTKFDGERAAAHEAAMRLLEKHRPDLANETYVRGIRSSTTPSQPKMLVNFAQQPIRGSSPDAPLTPIGDHTLSVVVDKLRALGHDISETDLLPTGKYGSILRALQVETGGLFTQDMFSDIEFNTIPKEVLGDADPFVLSDLLGIMVEQARKNMSVIKIDGHQVKKILGPVDEEVADILGDEVDIAMLRAQGAPTYEQLMDIAAAQKIEIVRLNRIFSTNGEIETNVREGSFLKTLERPGQKKKRKSYSIKFFLDDGKTEVASFDETKVNTKDNPEYTKQILTRLNAYPGRTPSTDTLLDILKLSTTLRGDSKVDTNDAIFGAMAEMVGYEYDNKSLNTARQNLKELQDLSKGLNFAPTPAGQHLKQMFENNIESARISLELLEKLGQRYVHLLRERGIDDEEIKTMLKTLNDSQSSFRNDEPIRRSGTTVLKQALDAYLRKKLGSVLIPQITDADFNTFGIHETGHFVLGQAFTRHGEFVANAWSYLVHGQAFWEIFVRGQRSQSELFDGYTIRERFGRKMTSQQMADWQARKNNRNLGPRDDLDGTPLDMMSPWLSINEQDKQQMLSDVTDRINDDPNLTDEEKLAIIASMEKGDFFIKSIEPRESRQPTEKETQDAIDLGIDPQTLNNNSNQAIRTDELYLALVPLPPRVFGWMRQNGTRRGMSSSTAETERRIEGERRRNEFASMLRTVLQLMGDSPVFFGTETPEEMALIERKAKQQRKQTLERFKSIIDSIEDMTRKHPTLKKEFAEELKRLK